VKNLNREDTVALFHKAMGQAIDETKPDSKLLELRYNLLIEEVKELGEEVAYAMAESHFKRGIPDKIKVRMLKEMADVQYVLSGFAVAVGLPLEIAFNRVRNSNMSKLGEDGKPNETFAGYLQSLIKNAQLGNPKAIDAVNKCLEDEIIKVAQTNTAGGGCAANYRNDYKINVK